MVSYSNVAAAVAADDAAMTAVTEVLEHHLPHGFADTRHKNSPTLSPAESEAKAQRQLEEAKDLINNDGRGTRER